MNEMTHPQDAFEQRLEQAARAFRYPPAPDVTSAVLRELAPGLRRAAWRRMAVAGLAVVALLLAAILAVPPVRAAVLEWIRIGAVRIFLVQPAATPTPTLLPGATAEPTRPVEPTPTPLASVLDLAGETSLEKAKERARAPILFPTYPADLGLPDQVFLQDLDVPSVMLVWMQKDAPGEVRLVLSETPSNSMYYEKMVPREVANTSVGGQPAYWVSAPYLLISGSGEMTASRLIAKGHTLIWTAGETTFRLETLLDLNEAIQIAESLR